MFPDLDPTKHLMEVMALYHAGEEELGEAFFRAAWRLACLRQITHGVTTVNAMDTTAPLGAPIVGQAGLRATIGPELSDLVDVADWREQVDGARGFIEDYHQSYQGRIRASIAPGGESGTTEPLWEAAGDLAQEYRDVSIHTHLLDLAQSEAMARASGSRDAVSLLADHGLLNNRTALTHFFHADKIDVERVAAAGVHIVHCATVYSYYRAGERRWFPLPRLQEAGVNIALGLDDPFWFDCWDLFQEAKHARLVGNYEYGAQQWTSRQLVEAITINGARALGIERQIGSLEVGKRADMILLRLDAAALGPLSNIPSLLANSVTGANVQTVIVDGHLLMRDGQVQSMDVEAVLAEARAQRRLLREKTGWQVDLSGSTPHKSFILGRISSRIAARYAAHYGKGLLKKYLPL
jgi:5-methylthioadenosine/S-adenosylhomocysteine deaminase